MFEKNNPVLISTNRTGSTVIGKMLYNIAAHKFGSKNYLNQYLTVTPHYKEVFESRDRIIQSISYERTVGNPNEFASEVKQRDSIILNRMELLANDTKYTMKIFAYDFSPQTYRFFKNHYDFIFLERRNKVDQLISFMIMMETNKHEYKAGEFPPTHCYFSFKECLSFIMMIAQYNKIKKLSANPVVIYYEDFMSFGGNMTALQQLLGFPIEFIPEKIKIDTVSSPYESDLEELLINKDEWLLHKPTILNLLEQC